MFDPVSNLFDVSNATSDDPYWSQTPNCFFTHEGVAAVTLDDGSVLATGGEISPMVWDQPDGIMPSPKLDTYYGAVLSEAWTYTLAGGKAQMPTMTVPRAGHTMTKLADGRVLIVGGRTLVNYLTNPPKPNPDPQAHYLSTATAEIYDPTKGTFTPTGSLNEARDGHAAILLPSGQVLIVGGVHENGDGTYSYPHTTELYDPDVGTFSIMDHLDYGLDEPKLVLKQDGQVILTGVISGMVPGVLQPFASRMSGLMGQNGGTVLIAELNVDSGFEALPEEPALQYYKARRTLIPTLNTQIDPAMGQPLLSASRPTKARISIPLPGEINQRQRYFEIRIPKGSIPGKGSVTGISVELRFDEDGYSQNILGTMSIPEPLAQEDSFFLDTNPHLPVHVEYDGSQTTLDQSALKNANSPALTRLRWNFWPAETTKK